MTAAAKGLGDAADIHAGRRTQANFHCAVASFLEQDIGFRATDAADVGGDFIAGFIISARFVLHRLGQFRPNDRAILLQAFHRQTQSTGVSERFGKQH